MRDPRGGVVVPLVALIGFLVGCGDAAPPPKPASSESSTSANGGGVDLSARPSALGTSLERKEGFTRLLDLAPTRSAQPAGSATGSRWTSTDVEWFVIEGDGLVSRDGAPESARSGLGLGLLRGAAGSALTVRATFTTSSENAEAPAPLFVAPWFEEMGELVAGAAVPRRMTSGRGMRQALAFQLAEPGVWRAEGELAAVEGASGLLLWLEPGRATVTELSVESRGFLESVLASSSDGPPRLTLDDSERPVLSIPGSTSVSWIVDVPAAAPRLETGIAALAPQPDIALEVHCTVDGERIASHQLPPTRDQSATKFEHWTVNLSSAADRIVELGFEVVPVPSASAEEDTAFVFLAHPQIRSDPVGSLPWNLVVISLDTLRADRLGCYGYHRDTSPNLDQLAASGWRFARVIANAAWTRPSHATIFSGQNPLVHGLLARTQFQALSLARTPWLPLELAGCGYVCAAVTAGGNVDPSFGFHHGFDRYDVRADTARIREWLRAQRDVPFLLFAHTYKVHNYRPSPAARRAIGVDVEPFDNYVRAQREVEDSSDRARLQRLSDLYDATVREADEQFLGAILRALDDFNLRERTVIAVLSDHGEGFLEHGRIGHSDVLFGEGLHVPWVLWFPGCDQRVVEEVASLEDVAPTLRELLGVLPKPDSRATGESLLQRARQDPIVMDFEDGQIAGIQNSASKLLIEGENQWRFDLENDPFERESLGADAFGGELLRELQALSEEYRLVRGALGASESMSEALRATLEELGYLDPEGAAPEEDEVSRDGARSDQN